MVKQRRAAALWPINRKASRLINDERFAVFIKDGNVHNLCLACRAAIIMRFAALIVTAVHGAAGQGKRNGRVRCLLNQLCLEESAHRIAEPEAFGKIIERQFSLARFAGF